MNLMTAEMVKMNALVREFANCKACIRKLYKSESNGKSPVIPVITSSAKDPAQPQSTPPQTPGQTAPTTTPSDQRVRKTQNQTTPQTNTSVEESSLSLLAQMLIGSPSRGIYVEKAKLDMLKTTRPKRFALKLFEMVFRREEAKGGSVEGKGEKLSRLDPNRLAAIKEETERRFAEDKTYSWLDVKKAIDEKCRMVRNNRCFVWAGVNVKTD